MQYLLNMGVKIKNRHQLKKKEIVALTQDISTTFGIDLSESQASIEIGTIEGYKVLLVDGEIDFWEYRGRFFFTLQGINTFSPQKNSVIVDMGAVGFITKGADVMAPGIVDADENISEGDFVWISDEKYRKPLAIGIALTSGEHMTKQTSGKAIHNLHYVGDKLWKLSTRGT